MDALLSPGHPAQAAGARVLTTSPAQFQAGSPRPAAPGQRAPTV